MSRCESKKTFAVILCINLGLLLLVLLMNFKDLRVSLSTNYSLFAGLQGLVRPVVEARESPECDDVLRGMVRGHWIRRHMTSADVLRMKKFHREVRQKQYGIPIGSQRPDKKCGNVAVSTKRKLQWFRALCDPDGQKPCCYNNRCVQKSENKCTCANCFDMRTPLHAEYATWRPVEETCRPRSMPVEEVCGLLADSTLHFIGDSITRHVYTAFLLAVNGDEEQGAFAANMPEDLKTKCSGLYMFSEKVCRLWVNDTTACNGTVKLHLHRFPTANYADSIKEIVQGLSGDNTRSLVFMNTGFHIGLNSTIVQQKILLPVLQTMKRGKSTPWPKLLWASMHQLGVMRSPKLIDNRMVMRFNKEMKEFFESWDVPVFDTFNLTDRVMSFDGQHYGLGVNRLKAQILLQYIRELRSRGQW